MSEEQGEVTSSSLLAAAQEYDTQKEAGIDEPHVEVMQLEPKAEEPEEIAEEEAAPKIDDVQNEESSLPRTVNAWTMPGSQQMTQRKVTSRKKPS